jgi:hypothetical protein
MIISLLPLPPISLSYKHAVEQATAKHTPGFNGYVPLGKIIPLLSNSAERPRAKYCIWCGINLDTAKNNVLVGLKWLGFRELNRKENFICTKINLWHKEAEAIRR